IDHARRRWLTGSHHRPTDILARMEPGKRPLRLIRGSLEPSDGPLRTAAILCLPKSVRWSPASRPPAALLRLAFLCHFRTFTANEVLRPKAQSASVESWSIAFASLRSAYRVRRSRPSRGDPDGERGRLCVRPAKGLISRLCSRWLVLPVCAQSESDGRQLGGLPAQI